MPMKKGWLVGALGIDQSQFTQIELSGIAIERPIYKRRMARPFRNQNRRDRPLESFLIL
jgi:hypothetical protein